MVQKKIVIILLAIVLLPLIFYTAYEFTSLNENEKLIEEIYQQQMNVLLYSVNQHAWDISSQWNREVNAILTSSDSRKTELSQVFLNNNQSIKALLYSDTSLVSFKSIPEKYAGADMINQHVSNDKSIMRKLIQRKSLGYSKIEAYMPEDEGRDLVLLFASETESREPAIVALIVIPERFINNVLVPKINDIARDEFIIAIFDSEDDAAIYATEPLLTNEIKIKRNIWLFPDHFLGIRTKGATVEDLANSRFYRSLILILILDVILLFGAWIVYRNIRKEMELARMKSDFVSNVSHELRTPLSLIRMYSETLEMGRVDTEEKKQEYYKTIGQETERLTHLMNNILDFSKMEAGAKKYQLEKIDLNDVVRHNLKIYGSHLESKGFDLDVRLSDERLEILADKEAISEAFINLLDNAAKYSEDTRHITISTGTEKNIHFLEVKDQGIGIAASEQKKVFEKFYRVSSGLMHNTKGSGLGLTLVQYIMAAHGGKIELTSEPGKGSCFRLLFDIEGNI